MLKIFPRRVIGSLLGLSMLTVAAPGLAENQSGAYSISPFVGGYTFEHKKSDKGEAYQDLETSPVFGVRAGYNFTENWGAEATFSYILAEARKPNYPEADVYNFGIDALYHFNPSGKLVPFLVAGIGGMVHDYPASGLGYYPEYTVNYGAGLKYFVADNVALRADVRHVFLPDDKLNNLVYTAGVTFQFGGNKPVVEAAVVPVCPAVPACPAPVPVAVAAPVVVAKDTTAPYVTLVSPYNDSKDVPVNRELHVSFSEAMDRATINSNTFTLQQGDKPVSGTVSASAEAPAKFKQSSDLQPDTLYTGRITTGATDLAGNPLATDFVWHFKTAPIPEPVVITKTKVETKKVFVDKFVMLTGSHFAFDSAVLTPFGKEALKQNIKILQENPEVRVQIQGHTSAAGSVKYNQALSERRANAVRDFVIKDGGIAADRIETIGYGETRPIAKEANPKIHNSPEAKENMRVVFVVIENK